MSKEMELEIKFPNETISDLEKQVLDIMKKYAELKCTEANKRKNIKHISEEKRSVFHKNENTCIERLNDEQLMNVLGISKRNLNKCY